MTKMPSPLYGSKQRNSSVELFRIIATFTVLIVHFNGWFLGGLPDKLEFHAFNWHFIQFLISAATCVCVNLFVIISGYFGLKFKISVFIHIGLLLLGIVVPLYVIGSVISGAFSLSGLLSHFLFVTCAGYFIQCYLMLVFLSPLLNLFIKNNSRRNVLSWTLMLWFVEIWFGCIQDVEALAFMKGYSVIHFVLIYMMARCVKLYQDRLLKYSKWFWIMGYLLCTVILWIMYGTGIRWGYANPINVVSSFCLFLPFLYFSFYNSYINWIAKSTFAVYIIQVTYPVFGVLCLLDRRLLTSLPYGLYLASAFGTIIVFFWACIIYDKLLGLFTKPIERIISQRIGADNYKSILFGA